MSEAIPLLTGLSNLYKSTTTNMLTVKASKLLTMPRRSSHSFAKILLTVVAASPDAIRTEGTYTKPKALNAARIRYSNPAILAVFFDELLVGVGLSGSCKLSLTVIVFSPLLLDSDELLREPTF